MSWNKEERYQLGLAAIKARETGADETEAIANAAIGIVAARRGLGALSTARLSVLRSNYANMAKVPGSKVAVEEGLALLDHAAAQDARIALLEEKLRANREEIARQISGENVRIGNAMHEALAHHYKERDALKVECERLRKVADDAKESTKIMAESARANSVQLDQWRNWADDLAKKLKEEQFAVTVERDAASAAVREAHDWRDRAFRQSRETIQKGIEAAQAKKEHRETLAQAQADQRALHDAMEWAHDWHGKDLPPPSRAVLALIDERDQYRKQHANTSAAIVRSVGEIGDLRKRLAETSDLMEAYRKAGMLEHERAEAGERMVAAMRKAEAVKGDYVRIEVPADSPLGRGLMSALSDETGDPL